MNVPLIQRKGGLQEKELYIHELILKIITIQSYYKAEKSLLFM
jgi:hypothetical protein